MDFGDFAIGASHGANQAIQTGLNLQAIKSNQMQMKNELALQPLRIKQLTSSIEAQETAARKADLELKQYEKEIELLPVEETARKFGFNSPEEIDLWTKKAGADIEVISGIPYIQRGKLISLFDKYKGNPEFNLELGEIKTKVINKNLEALKAQLENPETAGKIKPEQMKQLQDQYNALVNQRSQLANAIKIERMKLNLPLKDTIKNFYDPVNKQWLQRSMLDDNTGLIPEDVAKSQQKPLSLQHITKKFIHNGKEMAQDYAFNRATGEETPISSPRLSGKPEKPEKLSALENAYNAYVARAKRLYPDSRLMDFDEFAVDYERRKAKATGKGGSKLLTSISDVVEKETSEKQSRRKYQDFLR